jgi:tetratricopeptide (TPR) repeat protein
MQITSLGSSKLERDANDVVSETRRSFNVPDCLPHESKANSMSLQDGLELITALARKGRNNELGDAFEQLSRHFAMDAEALCQLSDAMNQIDRYADGLRFARQGLTVDPQNPFLYYQAARALWMCGAAEECFCYVKEAARLWPADATTCVQYFLSCVQLSLGDFEEGWKRNAIYYQYPSISSQLFRPNFPEWNGEPLAGCQFLYVLHAGFGDQIQFLRFVEWLTQQGATVDVLIDPLLTGIAASVPGVRTIYSYPAIPGGPYTYWSYMMRIPTYMGLKVSMLPFSLPYLATTQQSREYWRAHIESISPRPVSTRSRRIGFVWEGSPNTLNDRFRSIRLEGFEPLFELPSITWFSVQKGDAQEKSRSLANQFDVHTLGPVIEDFVDTLAILETLDLVITVDSSVAHLAGAAGLPVWVLLPAYSEWRWLTDRNDSPWYPSMRLFRQRELGNWRPVIDEVRDALREWCAMQPGEMKPGSA